MLVYKACVPFIMTVNNMPILARHRTSPFIMSEDTFILA